MDRAGAARDVVNPLQQQQPRVSRHTLVPLEVGSLPPHRRPHALPRVLSKVRRHSYISCLVHSCDACLAA